MRRPLACPALFLALVLATPAARAGDAPVAAPAAHVRDSFEAYRRYLAADGKLDAPELFTAASRVHLARAPRAPGAEAARLAELEAAAPLRYVVIGDRAALIPKPKRSTTHPVLLVRVAGTWRVDLVASEKEVEPADPGGGLRLRYGGSPYQPVLAYAYPGPMFVARDLEPIDLFGEDPAAAIARLEGASSPASRLRLAEILLRNCWLVDAAMPRYEELARSTPDPLPYVRLFGQRALVVGQFDRAIAILEQHEPQTDDLLAKLHARAGHFDVSQRYERRAVLEHLQRKGILEPVPGPEIGPGYQRL